MNPGSNLPIDYRPGSWDGCGDFPPNQPQKKQMTFFLFLFYGTRKRWTDFFFGSSYLCESENGRNNFKSIHANICPVCGSYLKEMRFQPKH
jgi:hypothetical protein